MGAILWQRYKLRITGDAPEMRTFSVVCAVQFVTFVPISIFMTVSVARRGGAMPSAAAIDDGMDLYTFESVCGRSQYGAIQTKVFCAI